MTLRGPGAALVLVATSACGGAPGGPDRLTLLFFNQSPAAQVGGRSWAPDRDGSRLVAFDGALRPAGTIAGPWLSQPVAVAPFGGRLLVSELTGDGVVVDTVGRLVREWPAVFAVSLYAAAPDGRRVVAARSPYRVPTLLPESPGAPLLFLLDTLGGPAEGLATISVPTPPFLAQFANAGAVAVEEGPRGAVYFAPLVRDEIRKYDANGTVLWIAARDSLHREPQLRYVSGAGGRVEVVHRAANLALALGPDGRLYALGNLRLDALDPATGKILLTRTLDSTETAIAVGPDGTVRTFDASALLRGAWPTDRRPFTPAFALPNLAGDTVRLSDYAGRVTLVNVWASWCHPCRAEFPHMARLYRDLDRRDFDIAAISDDVDRGEMLEFVRELEPPFPILVGRGRMKQAYHYRGLPYSVLLDRRGRVVERIFGFGGEREFARLRETIAKEVASP